MHRPCIEYEICLVAGNLQNGGLCHENARGRVYAGEADRQDLPPDGHEHGRQIITRRVHRGSQERPFHRPTPSVRHSGPPVTPLDISKRKKENY